MVDKVAALFRISILAEQNTFKSLSSELQRAGFTCRNLPTVEKAKESLLDQPCDLLLVDLAGRESNLNDWGMGRKFKEEHNFSIIGLVPAEALENLDPAMDDFVVKPYQSVELAARIKRLLWRRTNIDGEEMIKCGDLVINMAKCEVTLCGQLIDLAFREYELLRFLANNKERVFSRESLLNKVWGYDYFGGERTVDVHVRRLRSKIEDRDHSFIETVRNIGYKFKS